MGISLTEDGLRKKPNQVFKTLPIVSRVHVRVSYP